MKNKDRAKSVILKLIGMALLLFCVSSISAQLTYASITTRTFTMGGEITYSAPNSGSGYTLTVEIDTWNDYMNDFLISINGEDFVYITALDGITSSTGGTYTQDNVTTIEICGQGYYMSTIDPTISVGGLYAAGWLRYIYINDDCYYISSNDITTGEQTLTKDTTVLFDVVDDM